MFPRIIILGRVGEIEAINNQIEKGLEVYSLRFANIHT
jgi:hypothetical protein